MPHPSWNESCASGQLPWDTGQPEPLLVDFVRSGVVTPSSALEIGSGTGTNAIWMAERGFDVLGVDISPLAVESAHAKLEGSALRCRFATLDFLAAPSPIGLFNFVFDRGCFHVFDDSSERQQFAARVAAELAPGGVAIEPALEIVELRSAEFRDYSVKAWFCLSRQRTVSAQPSTLHL